MFNTSLLKVISKTIILLLEFPKLVSEIEKLQWFEYIQNGHQEAILF